MSEQIRQTKKATKRNEELLEKNRGFTMKFIPRINFDCEKNCECENPIKPDWYAKCLDCKGWHCFKCGQRIDHEMKMPYKYRKYEEELLFLKTGFRYSTSNLRNVTVILDTATEVNNNDDC